MPARKPRRPRRCKNVLWPEGATAEVTGMVGVIVLRRSVVDHYVGIRNEALCTNVEACRVAPPIFSWLKSSSDFIKCIENFDFVDVTLCPSGLPTDFDLPFLKFPYRQNIPSYFWRLLIPWM
ncbi:hypothetical protein WA026_005902 [Henosepilachna vigintioctopunctata]|uniref:Uncharacterized protein n=1 Tax=Henosepilachna vigintioctopunctata TaxID=420089 RepID=A0AAW1TXV9_9CUCU